MTNFPSEIKAGFELEKGRLPKSKDEVVVGYNFPLNLAIKNAPDYMYDEKGQLKEGYRYTGNIVGEKIELTVSQFKGGKQEEKKIPLQIVGISKKPTKEWVEDRSVYISEDVLTEIENFTGTPKGIMIDPSNNQKLDGIDANGDTYDEVKIYAKSMEAVQYISDQLNEKNYGTYSVVNELKEVNMVFMIAKAGLIFIGTIAILIASIGI